MHTGNTFIEQHIDPTWIFLRSKEKDSALSPICKYLLIYICGNSPAFSQCLLFYLKNRPIRAMSLQHACTVCSTEQSTYLRLGSEGMPLD